jgi:FtsH-binding integral membrane protein
MSEANSLSNELLKQEGLVAGKASAALLIEIQKNQARSEKRERFWFRVACAFWITVGICFLILVISFSVYPTAPKLPVATAALLLLPVALAGGLFSSVWLMRTRRQASQATMQATIASLTEEVHELMRRLENHKS